MFLIPLAVTFLAMAWGVKEASNSWGLSFFIGIIASLSSWLAYFAFRTFGVI